MSNVLVTGAGGFIGLQLVTELVRQKHTVYALIQKGDTRSEDKLHCIDSGIVIIDDAEVLFHNVEEYPPFNCIYHLATVGVRPDFNDINMICDVNIKMGCQLVDFARKNLSGVLVNFGSCFEYGDHGNALLTEDMACYPESLYAISKNASTNLTTCYARSQNVNMITVRPFGVFGEGEGLNRLAPSIIYSCMKGEVVKTTLGEQVRDFVNVKDLVKAVIKLSMGGYTPFEIYNVCSNNPVSVKEFILEIIDVCKFDISLVEFGSIPYRKNEAMIFAGDNRKLQNVIGYPFPHNHRDGILDIYKSMKAKG